MNVGPVDPLLELAEQMQPKVKRPICDGCNSIIALHEYYQEIGPKGKKVKWHSRCVAKEPVHEGIQRED